MKRESGNVVRVSCCVLLPVAKQRAGDRHYDVVELLKPLS